jgi:hypothetical protein
MNDSLINMTLQKIRKTLAGEKHPRQRAAKKKIMIKIRKTLAHRCAFPAHLPVEAA